MIFCVLCFLLCMLCMSVLYVTILLPVVGVILDDDLTVGRSHSAHATRAAGLDVHWSLQLAAAQVTKRSDSLSVLRLM